MVYKDIVLEASDRETEYSAKALMSNRPWLDRAISPPIAAEIEASIDALRNKQPEYEPLLYDIYLGEAAAALDRCLALRKEIQTIEAMAIDFARRYERSGNTRKIDKELDDHTTQITQLGVLGESLDEASKKFNSVDKEALAKQSSAYSVSNVAISDDLEKRDKKLVDRWEIVSKIDQAEESQHDIPGHALNFGERRGRLIKLLKLDLTEALKKLISIEEGIKVIHGADIAPLQPMPGSGSTSALDEIVLWTRSVIETIERLNEREIEFDLVIPMIQKSLDRQEGEIGLGVEKETIVKHKSTFVASNSEWMSKVFVGTTGKPLYSCLRLRGIGASISNLIPDDGNHKTAICNVVVFPPSTPRALDKSMTKWMVRPPIFLGNVRPAYSGSAVSMEYGVSAHNQRIVGEWHVRVLNNVATATAEKVSREAIGAVDLKLHLRVIGLPSNNHEDW